MALRRTEAPAKRSPTGSARRGTGSGEYKVKGRRATAHQRATIDGCLQQAQDDNASRRVMIAVIMCITQESGAGELANVMTGDDDVGIFQQGRNWISVEGSKDPAASTHAFLTSPKQGWRAMHGSVKKAPGNLSLAIHAVQRNRDPNAYAQWEPEATRTVDAWLDSGGSSEGGGSYAKQYNYTRGEKGGQEENSWDASARLVGEVGAYRWAAANTFYAASGDEIRSQAPSLTIRGDEGWLVKPPSWSWASNRAISEVTLEVLADRWGILPGAVVRLPREYGAMQGKWMVWNVSGNSLTDPVTTVVLRRPTRRKTEPATQRVNSGSAGSDGDSAGKIKGAIAGSPVPGQRPGPSTHPTGGLAGYPARDYFGPPGTPCVAPEDGTITRLSGRDPKLGGVRGGAMGRSIYLEGEKARYFLTHLDHVVVKAGDRVDQGDKIAEIAKSGAGSWDNSSTHVHMGVQRK